MSVKCVVFQVQVEISPEIVRHFNKFNEMHFSEHARAVISFIYQGIPWPDIVKFRIHSIPVQICLYVVENVSNSIVTFAK